MISMTRDRSGTTRIIFIFTVMIIAIIAASIQGRAETCIDFFYGTGCPHCAAVSPEIERIAAQDEITVLKHDVYTNREEALVLDRLLDERGIEQERRAVPATIIGNTIILGSYDFNSKVDRAIKENKDAPCATTNGTNYTDSETTKDKITGLTLGTIIGAAIVDSINPCAIAVIILLLGGLLATGDKKKALYAGMAFTASIYIAYLLFGLGLLSAIQISGFSAIVVKGAGVLAIIIGLLNIKDFIWYGGGGFVIEIPRAWRPRLKQMLEAITSPAGAFAIGFTVCLFELPCTGGPYLFILGLLSDKTTILTALPWLVVYNLFFVLPLLLITFMMYYGIADAQQVGAWKERNLRLLHLIAGIVMTALGIIALWFIR